MTQKLTGTIVGVDCGGSCGRVEYYGPNGEYRCATIDDKTVGRDRLTNRLGGQLKTGARVTIVEEDFVHGKRHLAQVG